MVIRHMLVLAGILAFWSAAPAAAWEAAFHKEGANGWFRLTVPPSELADCSAVEVNPEPSDGMLFQVTTGSSRQDLRSSRAQIIACRQNMRVLQGASEMYGMDHEKPFTGSDQEYIDTLYKNKYLYSRISGPSGRCRYRFVTDSHGSKTVRCDAHGTIEPEADEREQIRKADEESLLETPSLLVFGRCRGAGPARLRLHDRRDGRLLREITLEIPANTVTDDPRVRDDWFDTWKRRMIVLERQTPADSLFSYLARQVPLRLGLIRDEPEQDRVPIFRRRDTPDADLYSLTTGALAIQEALQLDRMSRPPASATVADQADPITVLSGPEIKSHPYETMLSGREPRGVQLDRLVPAEFYACHFSNINSQIAFGDLLDQWGTSLLHTLQAAAHDARVKEKLLDQLCLETSELTRLFGDRVIADLTICGADPFLHEGTDLSVLFTVKNRALFDMMAQKRFAAAHERFPQAREERLDFDGIQVFALTTPDRHLHSFSCMLDGVSVYSNSNAAIGRIIAVWRGRHPSLAQAADYRYMRTVFPHDPATEDVFLYLSDAHIRQLVGPVWKIARRRQLHCIGSLRLLQNAITLYADEHPGKTPALADLVADNCMKASYLFCPEGGTFTLASDTLEPACSFHGRLRYLQPIIERPPSRVTKEEISEYKTFVDSYKQYWRRFFDPVGIRGRLATDGISLETCILPLVENSLYDGFKTMCGGTPASLDLPIHPKTIGLLAGKLNGDGVNTLTSGWDETIRQLIAGSTLTKDEFLRAIGPGFVLGLVDGDLRFEFMQDTSGLLMIDMARDPARAALAGVFLYSLNLPVFSVVQVRDETLAARFLREFLDQLVRHSMGSESRFSDGLRLRTYETSLGTGKPSYHTLELGLFVVRFRFFFAIHDGALLISTQRGVLERMLNGPVERLQTTANLEFRLRYKAFDRISEATRLGWQEQVREACLNNLGSLYALSRLRGIPLESWSDESLRINGYVPFCPEGGVYRDEPGHGGIICSIHGTPEKSRQPESADTAQPLNRFVDSLEELIASLEFTPEGIFTRTTIRRKQ
ncbi:MAG: hypothetical protein BWY66_02062 [bacterium ADurb.Bin374]|nr:MAG: hypothetical protein BWY66_02062 [bacterium ADurb.Bin374]